MCRGSESLERCSEPIYVLSHDGRFTIQRSSEAETLSLAGLLQSHEGVPLTPLPDYHQKNINLLAVV